MVEYIQLRVAWKAIRTFVEFPSGPENSKVAGNAIVTGTYEQVIV